MARLSVCTRVYIGFIILAGTGAWAISIRNSDKPDIVRFLCYLVVAAFASGLKVHLPSINGTLSTSFLFNLIGVVELSQTEALSLGAVGIIVQCLWRTRNRPRAVQVAFNIAANGLATLCTWVAYSRLFHSRWDLGIPVSLLSATSVYFLISTLSVAGVISLAEKRPLRKTWHDCYFWSFPYYLAGAFLVWLLHLLNGRDTHPAGILFMPALYLIYRSYRSYLDRLDGEKKHVEDMAGLHLRTIESLAMAIEAKDQTTHDHLQRVRVYAEEIGKEMGLEEEEMNALRAAAMLHDIGKLAVPEHIISKPGRLTPEEFEKMKIHPVVGAAILERVKFPYPVAPIVRSHHENWNGKGYPDGLKGDQIPVGARILSAVDCLDALASDRQYRRALPLDEAMQIVVAESGTCFDPAIVAILKRRYKLIEPLAVAEVERARVDSEFALSAGGAPAAGFVSSEPATGVDGIPALSSIAAARQEAQMLYELTQDLGSSLSLDETLSVVGVRLKRMVPYDSIAIRVANAGAVLVSAYANGEDFRLLLSNDIPFGRGPSGWVAENRQPILNGSPAMEHPPSAESKAGKLSAALAVPLETINGLLGVLTLYGTERDAFTNDHLRILLAISSKLSQAIDNALKYRQAESSATIDYLTGLPNARSLFMRLEAEIARCERENSTLAVLVGDLNGFKPINDRFGHLTGNKVLRAVSEALQRNCRPYDYVARMGGDEFVMVFPGVRSDDLGETAARLRAAVAKAGSDICKEDVLSISVGIATFPDHGMDAEQLLAEADRRMYKAKHVHKQQCASSLVVTADLRQPVTVH